MMKSNYQNSNNKNSVKMPWNFWQGLVVSSISLAMIFFMVSAVLPASYKAFASVAINQKRIAGIDAYREAKSSEFMARTVKEMIMSNSFMKDILVDNQIVWTEMNRIESQDEKIKYWKKKIKVAVVPNTGVLSILVYTRDRELSKMILIKIVERLQSEETTFLADKGVKIEVINEPYYFHKQATPNLGLNTVLGFIVGAVLVVVFTLFKEKDIFNIPINKTDKKHKTIKNTKYTELSSKEMELFSKAQYKKFNFK